MDGLMLIAVLLAPGGAPAGGADVRPAAGRDDALVCRTLAETGSRLARKRICMTRLGWEEHRRLQRAELERMQVNGGDPSVD